MLARLSAVALLVATVPLVVPFLLGIQISSPGSILFRQLRIGKHGRVFGMWKLRTMVPMASDRLGTLLRVDAAVATEWAVYGRLKDDPRIAGPFARWARLLSIDEIPQLLNVMLGHMSIVGPRPILPEQANRLEPSTRRVRESVLPGLTGLWQVSGRSETTLKQMVRLDLLYVRRRSVLLNLYVLCRTPSAVLSLRGAY